MDFIGQLYHHEAQARERQLTKEALLTFRAEHAKPLVNAFLGRLRLTLRKQVLLLSNPFTKAAQDALEREAACWCFWSIRTSRWIPISWNERFGRLQWEERLGSFTGPKSGHSRSASCRAYWRRVGCRASSPMSTWSTPYNGLTPTPPSTSISLCRASGSNTSLRIPCAPISIASVNNAAQPPLTKLQRMTFALSEQTCAFWNGRRSSSAFPWPR